MNQPPHRANLASVDPWTIVSASEFRERQDKLRARLAEMDLDGAVVWSRGGGAMDMSADVLYLCNHYPPHPYDGDDAGLGRALSHAACIVPTSGPTTLVADGPYWRRDLVVADDVRVSKDLPAAAAAAVRDLGLDPRRLAFVGLSYMSASAYLDFAAALPATSFTFADDLVKRIRMYKSEAECELIRMSSRLGVNAVEEILAGVVDGQTEAGAVALPIARLHEQGVALYDAVASSGPHSHIFSHARLPGFDATRPMQHGDLFHIDFYGALGGYLFDLARSRCVGDEPTDEQRGLLEAAISGVDAVVAAVRPGLICEDLAKVGVEALGELDVRVAGERVPVASLVGWAAFGHGLGLSWEPPFIRTGDMTVLEPRMYLAVELSLYHPSIGGAMYEHNFIVTESGCEVLTLGARARWW
jgi:Xaa-Pro aminopeptidase